MWDEDLLQWSTIEKLDEHTDVFQYVRNSMAPHPTREYCVLRYCNNCLYCVNNMLHFTALL